MVINKTSSIIMTLGASLQMDDSELLRETAGESLSDACELSNWIKYLQIVPDLFALSSLILDTSSSEKRREIRYPLPAELEGRINVLCNDMFETMLLNFSQRGMQILSPLAIKEGTVLQCHLVSDDIKNTKSRFKASVMYCIPTEDSFMCGARVSEMKGNGSLNLFSLVHQLIMDYTGRAITVST